MNIKPKTWFLFTAIAIISLAAWCYFSYPQFSFIDLSISRKEALKIADTYLSEKRGVDTSIYQKVCVFSSDVKADRYLQKALGFKKEREFVEEHDYDLFFWVVRFFRENEKEEYRLSISAATGEVTALSHTIENIEKRESIGQEKAKLLAIQFLKDSFGFNLGKYKFQSQLATKRENRTDYSFSWEKNNVYIPWSDKPTTGGAKLLIGATVSGKEVLSFHKNGLDIPEKFSRFIARQKSTGANLSIVFTIFYIVILVTSTFFVATRRNHLAMHVVKNFIILLTGILFLFNLSEYINKSQSILFNYSTTSSIASYLWRYSFRVLITTFFATLAILMPGLSGEALHYETLRQHRKGSFLYYINSTFLSRNVFQSVVLGYIIGIIMLGIQSTAFEFGRQYMNVWAERPQITQVSTSYLPFLTAFIIGFRASIVEEITYRVFTISWIKKITKRISLAVIISSIVWGFGHINYPVFPMWFRGIEVTCIGMLLAFTYLRFGIIPVIVAHYCFNVFWCGANFLFGRVSPFNFYSILFIILLPLIYGILSYLINRPEKKSDMHWRLNKHQLFNLSILRDYVSDRRKYENKTPEEIKQELISHGWDIAVVEKAFENNSENNYSAKQN